MDEKELDDIVVKHRKWLKDRGGGVRADLRYAHLQGADLRNTDLQDADLRGAVLRHACLQGADLRGADLKCADLRGANLKDADLKGADLKDSDIRGADLQGAELDYSCFPLWCGGARFKCAPSLIYQIFAHVCSLEVVGADDELNIALSAIRKEAEKSHRAADLGLIGGKE